MNYEDFQQLELFQLSTRVYHAMKFPCLVLINLIKIRHSSILIQSRYFGDLKNFNEALPLKNDQYLLIFPSLQGFNTIFTPLNLL